MSYEATYLTPRTSIIQPSLEYQWLDTSSGSDKLSRTCWGSPCNRFLRCHLAIDRSPGRPPTFNEYGTFVGAVTLEDLLEEIVGDIEDETDSAVSEATVEKLDGRRWECDGQVSLRDIQKLVGLDVPTSLDAGNRAARQSCRWTVRRTPGLRTDE